MAAALHSPGDLSLRWGWGAFLTCRASTPRERILCLLPMPISAPQALGTKATPWPRLQIPVLGCRQEEQTSRTSRDPRQPPREGVAVWL